MEHLPPWLRNVPLPPPPTDADETPDWLRGIDSFTPPPSTAAHTPDWLTESAEQAEAASIPDWLAELQAECPIHWPGLVRRPLDHDVKQNYC